MATDKKLKFAAAAGSLAALRVLSLSPLGTLRRAGLVFDATPKLVPLASITQEQVDAIRAEPLLDVTDAELEPEPKAAKA